MKHIYKGILLWVFNNALLLFTLMALYDIIFYLSLRTVITFIISGILWVFTGAMIVGSFVDAKKEEFDN